MILFAAVAFSCGDGNRSSEVNDDEIEDNNTEMVEPADTVSTMDSDTTLTGDMNRRDDDGDMDRGEAGTSGREGSTDSRNQRDTL